MDDQERKEKEVKVDVQAETRELSLSLLSLSVLWEKQWKCVRESDIRALLGMFFMLSCAGRSR